MADFVRCPNCDRLFTVGDGEPLDAHYNKDGVLCEEKKPAPAGNHPSHFFVAINPGDCPRCIGCAVRSGSIHAVPPCPGIEDAFKEAMGDAQPYGERNVLDTADIVIEELFFEGDKTPCQHPGIERAEGNYFWCAPCHRYIGNNGYRKATAQECVELSFDRDSGRYAYPEDANW